ncbi:MAG: DUF3800 domain-containing protein [Spiroplasma sp.]|nr:DUF3800 domain-containing protein [Spiroplasma sp.]
MMEYFLYLDDSGSFLNKNDKHVIYGGVLFNNKNKRNSFIKDFKLAKNKVTKKSEIKGNDLAKKYIKHKKSPYKKADIENLIKQYQLVDALFCIWTCKDDLSVPAFDEEHAKLKRNEMIALLLKKLIESNKIMPDSVIRIYIDASHTEKIQEMDANILHKYLNKDYSTNKIIRFLRAKKIYIHKVSHLDSKKADCIQAADIIVNFSNKYLDQHRNAKELLNLFNNFEFYINACKFPKIRYNNNMLNITCCWSESSR